MLDLLSTLFEVGFFAALIRISTPLILATLGEVRRMTPICAEDDVLRLQRFAYSDGHRFLADR